MGIRSYEEEKKEWEEKRKQKEGFLRWKKEKLQRTCINEIEEDKKREQGKNEREWKKQREELRRWEEK